MPTLDFKGKQHIYAHHLTVPYRPLVPDAGRSLHTTSADDNLIIHGDNLHALKALLPRYAGRVKCIYIDPPYNTGNECWKYNDNVNSLLMQAWLKQAVDRDDLERHDKWLCMMWPRLHLLRELLADDGVIFVSIDDNEQHHLRMLMDEIFGEENFVANLVWRKKTGGGQDTEYFAREHEHVICYRTSDSYTIRFRQIARSKSEFPKLKQGRRCKFVKLEKWGSSSLRQDRPTMFYAIKDPDGQDFFPRAPDGREGNWRTRPTALDSDHIHWEKRSGRWTPYEVIYFDEVADIARVVKERTILYDVATTTVATNEQKGIFGKKVFDNSKPSELVKRLVMLSTNPDDIVLDSFAGSGTTAHAVLALNKEDGGSRKFILVECEEKYANTITAERVRRVINGVPTARDAQLREGLGGSFTYCTLGEPIDAEGMLTGTALPSYAALAAYLLHTASGASAPTAALERRNDDGLFYTTDAADYYLLYQPNLDWLLSKAAVLGKEQADRIAAASCQDGHRAIVFAVDKYMGQRYLTDMNITFCRLPYEMYQEQRGVVAWS